MITRLGFRCFYEMPDAGGGGDGGGGGGAAPASDKSEMEAATAGFLAELKGEAPTQKPAPAPRAAAPAPGAKPPAAQPGQPGQPAAPAEDPIIELPGGQKFKASELVEAIKEKGHWYNHWQSTFKRQLNEKERSLHADLVQKPVQQFEQTIDQRLAPVMETLNKLAPLLQQIQGNPPGAQPGAPAVRQPAPSSPEEALSQFRSGIVNDLVSVVKQVVGQAVDPIIGEYKSGALTAVNEAIQIYAGAGRLGDLHDHLVKNGVEIKIVQDPKTGQQQLVLPEGVPPNRIREIAQQAVRDHQSQETEIQTHVAWGNEAFKALEIDPSSPAVRPVLTLWTQAWNAAIRQNEPASKELALKLAQDVVNFYDQSLQGWGALRGDKLARAAGQERKLPTTPSTPPAGKPGRFSKDPALNAATAAFAEEIKSQPG